LYYFYVYGNMESMDIQSAVTQLSSIAQAARLEIFRVLVQAGADGVPAGSLGERLNIPPSTLSFHLKELSRAGMISSRQVSRFIYYSANYQAMNTLLAYLTENCCAGVNECCPDVSSCNPGKDQELTNPGAASGIPVVQEVAMATSKQGCE
jgi:ArsR family transcriptional regulator, arsenate/arsenite/antimonite-responsive transcriptional repressor